jgi:hypothetical protein
MSFTVYLPRGEALSRLRCCCFIAAPGIQAVKKKNKIKHNRFSSIALNKSAAARFLESLPEFFFWVSRSLIQKRGRTPVEK